MKQLAKRPATLLATLVAGASALVAPTACGAASLRSSAGPYTMEVLVGGVPVPSFSHRGETYVLGSHGDRYTLRIHNRSARRVEAVVSVDGRDVIDGKPASFASKRGYLIAAWGSVDIDGWRLSNVEAAAFRFSSVAESYAAQTGSARDVGVVGVAIFPERFVPPPPPPVYRPYPGRPYPDDLEREDALLDSTSAAPRGEARAAEEAPAPAASAPGAGSGYGGAGKAEGKASRAPRDRYAEGRPGLGTEFGEAVPSQITEVPFERAHRSSPSALLGVRYNDRPGLLAMGIDVDGRGRRWSDGSLRRTAEPFPVVTRGYAAPPPGWTR